MPWSPSDPGERAVGACRPRGVARRDGLSHPQQSTSGEWFQRGRAEKPQVKRRVTLRPFRCTTAQQGGRHNPPSRSGSSTTVKCRRTRPYYDWLFPRIYARRSIALKSYMTILHMSCK